MSCAAIRQPDGQIRYVQFPEPEPRLIPEPTELEQAATGKTISGQM